MCISASGTKSRAPQARECRGVWGYPPPGNFEKTGYLRQHFVLGNKAGKSEGHYVECIIEINLESHNLNLWWTVNPKDHIECK